MNRLLAFLFMCIGMVLICPNAFSQDNFLDSIPKGITPNGDGYNDTWVIPVPGQTNKIMLDIYDRWGKLIRRYSDYHNDWDGTYANGKKLKNGTYYYRIQVVKDGNNNDVIGTGWINIMR